MLLNHGVGEDSWESLGLQGDLTSPSSKKSVLSIHWKDWYWSWSWNSKLWPPDAKNRLIREDPDARKDWRQEEKGTTEDEMVEWHHQLPKFAQTHVHWVSDTIQPSHPLSSPSPPAFNLSQHQGLLKRISSSHQVAKVLEFQLQHQSFQWIFRTDFL